MKSFGVGKGVEFEGDLALPCVGGISHTGKAPCYAAFLSIFFRPLCTLQKKRKKPEVFLHSSQKWLVKASTLCGFQQYVAIVYFCQVQSGVQKCYFAIVILQSVLVVRRRSLFYRGKARGRSEQCVHARAKGR